MKVKNYFFSGLFFMLPFLASSEEIRVTVNGMVCSFCAQGIKKSFNSTKGAVEVTADLEQKLVIIRTAEKNILSDEQVKEIIHDAGYHVVSIH